MQGALHDRRSLLLSGGICLVCSSCLPPCQCPPWHCLGSLVHFVGPFWSWPKLFGITICSVLSSLLPHLSDWQAPAVYWKILVYRDWTQIPITGFLKIKYHIGCICLTFLHCAFSCVSSNCLPERKQSHISCICSTFLQCVLSCVSSNGLPLRMQSHIGCICFTFPHWS